MENSASHHHGSPLSILTARTNSLADPGRLVESRRRRRRKRRRRRDEARGGGEMAAENKPEGLKKIRNPERMVRIAVGYTGHTPPKSDDTDANTETLVPILVSYLFSRPSWRITGGKAYQQNDKISMHAPSPPTPTPTHPFLRPLLSCLCLPSSSCAPLLIPCYASPTPALAPPSSCPPPILSI
ncbi:calmodulin-binding transcription activator 1-like isoform X1 [Lates japonicus]|uniref:Calmodulin-binding transcription activator 1-like isoform X1 n=1 Tax=Lates japonicus TaxID=270547 RepID=A0AAD3RDW8_LATJO|nr:calmodulin-binding transcription activator 1-like isoform X1 [Lates japonicus]